jgi:hypothetical protein
MRRDQDFYHILPFENNNELSNCLIVGCYELGMYMCSNVNYFTSLSL